MRDGLISNDVLRGGVPLSQSGLRVFVFFELRVFRRDAIRRGADFQDLLDVFFTGRVGRRAGFVDFLLRLLLLLHQQVDGAGIGVGGPDELVALR